MATPSDLPASSATARNSTTTPAQSALPMTMNANNGLINLPSGDWTNLSESNLLHLLSQIYIYSGGDSNRREDDARRIDLINNHQCCERLIRLLRRPTLGTRITALGISCLRNLGRSEMGNDKLFRSSFYRDSHAMLTTRPGQFLSAKLVASIFGLLWSQILRRQQGEEILLNLGSGFPLTCFDLMRFYKCDAQVQKFGIGLLLAIATCNPRHLSSRLFGRFVSDLMSLDEDSMEPLAESLGTLLNRLPTSSYDPEVLVWLLTHWAVRKPRLAGVCLGMLDKISQTEPTRLKASARVKLSGYFDTTQDETQKELLLKIIGRCAKRETLPRGAVQAQSVWTIPSLAVEHHQTEALAMAMDHRGARLAVAGSDGAAYLLNIRYKSLVGTSMGTSREPQVLWRLHSATPHLDHFLQDFTSVCFSSDSTQCAFGTIRGWIIVVDTATGRVLFAKNTQIMEEVWFVSFCGSATNDELICFGQGESCSVYDMRRSSIDRICSSFRVASSPVDSFLFISYGPRTNDDDDDDDDEDDDAGEAEGENANDGQTSTTVFRLARNAETLDPEIVFVKDLHLDLVPTNDNEPRTDLATFAIGVSFRFAIASLISSNRISLFDTVRGIPISHLDGVFDLNQAEMASIPHGVPVVENTLVSYSGSKALLVSSRIGQVVCVDTLQARVIYRETFHQPILSAAFAVDGSYAVLQLDNDDDPEATPYGLLKLDFNETDRAKLVALCQMDRTIATDVLRRIKSFLI